MLTINRLKLRPIQPKDSKALFQYRSDAETNRFQGWIPNNLKDAEDFIERSANEFNQPESWFQLIILEKSSEKIIGDIGIHFVGKENAQCELGCTLSKEFQSKGFATEALTAVIDYLFSEMGKHRITASIDSRNEASINLFKKLKFRKEAHFKKGLFSNGIWSDYLVYAILKEEWVKMRW